MSHVIDKQPLVRKNYFHIYNGSPSNIDFILYSEPEVRRIHRNFGHPSVRAIESLLKREKGDTIDVTTRIAIERIGRDFDICKRTPTKPHRFKMSVGTEDLRFNYELQVDTMFITGKPVIHIVDVSTHFCAAGLLRSQSTSEIWRMLTNLWMNVYLGPLYFLLVDQGSRYISKEMRMDTEAADIQLRNATIENPGSIGVVERYHAPLRKAFDRIRRELDRTDSDDDFLRLAVFSVNTTVGPEGL